jgi:hypothetical protein
MENLLLKIVYYYCYYFDIFLFKGLLTNYTPVHGAVFIDGTDGSVNNWQKIFNCSFENITGTFNSPGPIGVWEIKQKYNVTNCFFRNISSTNGDPRAGAINCDMNVNNNTGYFNISENTFFNIRTNRSTVRTTGNFLSLTFSYNSFYNVSSTNQAGGVF